LEIKKVEEKIAKEKDSEIELIRLQLERANEEVTAAEAKRAEDKILKGKTTKLPYS
jgi:hypothetical protein